MLDKTSVLCFICIILYTKHILSRMENMIQLELELDACSTKTKGCYYNIILLEIRVQTWYGNENENS